VDQLRHGDEQQDGGGVEQVLGSISRIRCDRNLRAKLHQAQLHTYKFWLLWLLIATEVMLIFCL
jgi:hypothetical protein